MLDRGPDGAGECLALGDATERAEKIELSRAALAGATKANEKAHREIDTLQSVLSQRAAGLALSQRALAVRPCASGARAEREAPVKGRAPPTCRSHSYFTFLREN